MNREEICRDSLPLVRAGRPRAMHALVATSILLGGAAGAAGGEPPPSPRICAAMQDDGQRLACYDQLFRHSSSERHATPSAEAEREFGLEQQRAREERSPLKRLTSRVVAVSREAHGQPVVVLANGQTWKGVEGEDPTDIEVGETVTIRAGVLGAYYLSDRRATIRVRRIR